MTTREDVVREALSWVGTPYHHMADVKGADGGVDCAMILVRVYCDLGIVPLFDPRPYPSQWHLNQQEERYLRVFGAYCHRVEEGQPGDVALYKYGQCVSHSGIIVAPGYIVHATIHDGAVMLAESRTFEDAYHSTWSVFP